MEPNSDITKGAPVSVQSGNLPTVLGLCTDEDPQTAVAAPSILRILILEDSPNDLQLMVEELKRVGFKFEWECVQTEAEYLARLDGGFDLILSDYGMPQFDGLRALELLKARPELDIPFIIVSGTIGEETAVAAIKDGAADYLLKDRIARLGPAVNRSLREVEERREKKRLQQQFLEAQKMEIIGQLSAGIAHDFNNVLAVIMGYADLLEAGPRRKPHLAAVHRGNPACGPARHRPHPPIAPFQPEGKDPSRIARPQ